MKLITTKNILKEGLVNENVFVAAQVNKNGSLCFSSLHGACQIATTQYVRLSLEMFFQESLYDSDKSSFQIYHSLIGDIVHVYSRHKNKCTVAADQN
jgi:hypothetical protein